MDPPPYTCAKRRQDFYFQDGFINLDQHGTPFYPREVVEAKVGCRAEFEECPKLFQEQNHHQILFDAYSLCSTDISCSPDDIAVMRSTTDALSYVIQALAWPSTFTFCFTGPDSNAAMRYFQKNNNGFCNVIKYHELSVEEMRAKIWSFVSTYITLINMFPRVIVDLVPADPVQTLALHTIIQELRERYPQGVFIIYDENGLGLTNFRPEKNFPDAYITSPESWWYSGSPCAFVYTSSGMRHLRLHWLTRQLVEEHERFDYPDLYAVKAAKQYINAIGGLYAVQTYQNELAQSAHSYLLAQWKLPLNETKTNGSGGIETNGIKVEETKTHVAKGTKMHGTELRLSSPIFFVKCPFQPNPEQQTSFIDFMKDRLREKHDILMAFVVSKGSVQIRFSAAIYLDLHDFEVARAAVDESISHWLSTVPTSTPQTSP